jgi:DNA-directed RNA polymerase sigma subunit (sigma70/sigma32)
MQPKARITVDSLSGITVRQRAMLKLQYGGLPLTEEELACVAPERRAEATVIRPRCLKEVAALFYITRERVRQINKRSLGKLGLTGEDWRSVESDAGTDGPLE